METQEPEAADGIFYKKLAVVTVHDDPDDSSSGMVVNTIENIWQGGNMGPTLIPEAEAEDSSGAVDSSGAEEEEECDQNEHPQDEDTGPGGGDPEDDDGTEHPGDDDEDSASGGIGFPADEDEDPEGHPSDEECYSTIPDSYQ